MDVKLVLAIVDFVLWLVVSIFSVYLTVKFWRNIGFQENTNLLILWTYVTLMYTAVYILVIPLITLVWWHIVLASYLTPVVMLCISFGIFQLSKRISFWNRRRIN